MQVTAPSRRSASSSRRTPTCPFSCPHARLACRRSSSLATRFSSGQAPSCPKTHASALPATAGFLLCVLVRHSFEELPDWLAEAVRCATACVGTGFFCRSMVRHCFIPLLRLKRLPRLPPSRTRPRRGTPRCTQARCCPDSEADARKTREGPEGQHAAAGRGVSEKEAQAVGDCDLGGSSSNRGVSSSHRGVYASRCVRRRGAGCRRPRPRRDSTGI